MFYVIKKASKRLHIIRVVHRCGLSPSDLLVVYFSLVQSTLEYACSVWHTMLPTYLSDKIEKAQKRAFRVTYPEVEYTDALRIAQCKRLSERRQVICEQTLRRFRILTACKLNYILTLLRSNKHDRKLRNNYHYCLPRCRTERYKNSFISKMCSTFNSEQ